MTPESRRTHHTEREQEMFTHPETKEEESKSCTSERREQSLGGEGPVEILGTTRTQVSGTTRNVELGCL